MLDSNPSYSAVNGSKDVICGHYIYKTETTYEVVNTRNIDVGQIHRKGKNMRNQTFCRRGIINFAEVGMSHRMVKRTLVLLFQRI